MKIIMTSIVLSALLLNPMPARAHGQQQQQLPKNAFLKQEYTFMRPEMLYGTYSAAPKDEKRAREHLEKERQLAVQQLLISNMGKIGLTVGCVLLLFKKFVDPRHHQNPFDFLVFPLVWTMGYTDLVMDTVMFRWQALKKFYCGKAEQYGALSYMDPMFFCNTVIQADKLTDLEIKLISQWASFPENKRLQLGNMIFDLRRGNVQDTTASFTAITNALSLPVHPKQLTYDPVWLTERLKGQSAELIQSLKSLAMRHFSQSSSVKGKKTSLFFEGPQGTGKTDSARNLASSLSLPFCEINYSDPQSTLMGSDKAMGKIAECMIAANATNPVLILNEVDRGLSPANLGELLMLSDPNQGELTDHFLGIPVPLDRTMIIYAVNNPIDDRAFRDRVRSFFFPGFALDYRINYANTTYVDKLIADKVELGITRLDMVPLVNAWAQNLTETEKAHNITLGSMRDVEKHMEDLFFNLYSQRYEQGTCSTKGCP